ncbi:MAG: head GIN domain-containing protein [Sphingomicrobium sp.]
MNVAKFLAAAAALGLLTACDDSIVGQLSGKKATEPGPIVERAFTAGAFTKIALGAAADVEIRADGPLSIKAIGGENFLNQTEVVVEDGTLRIRTKGHNIRWHSTDDKQKLHFVITGAGAIEEANIGGSGNIRIDRTLAKSFDGNIGGSGNLKVAGLAVGKASFAIGGSGNVEATGTAQSTEVAIGGSGDVDASGLAAKTAEVNIAGHGDVHAQASDTAEVVIVGSGDVTITGGAKCKVDKLGGGNVNCS